MIPTHGQVVVIDDQESEGLQITKAAWSAGVPVLFALYDPETWAENDSPFRGLVGVRLVFTDIDLLGGGMKGSGPQLFGAVHGALDTLLAGNNGPYSLVAWTSYQEHADGLRHYLLERLTPQKRPLNFTHLSKAEFLSAKPGELRDRLASLFDGGQATSIVGAWESDVARAASEVARELAEAARLGADNNGHEVEDWLRHLLLRLAVAEAGTAAGPESHRRALYSVLAALVGDEVGALAPSIEPLPAPGVEVPGEALDGWRVRINTMLGMDPGAQGPGSGVIVEYTSEGNQLPFPAIEDVGKFIRAQLLNCRYVNANWKSGAKKANTGRIRLVAMDVSPPCDHAQGKVGWRRFVFGAVVPEDLCDSLWAVNDAGDPIPGRPSGDYLWVSTTFQIGDSQSRVVFSGRLVASIPDDQVAAFWEHAEVVGRMRERLFVDFLGWLGRHSTRIGHLSV